MRSANPEDYWVEYYRNPPDHLSTPSSFASWVIVYLPKLRVCDVGCGNGRDMSMFNLHGCDVVGVDKIKGADALAHDYSSYHCIYSRWLLHSLSAEDQYKLISRWTEQSKPETVLMLEFRDSKGKIPDETHFRRLVDSAALVKILEPDWEIIHYSVADGRSPIKGDNPQLARIICKRRLNRVPQLVEPALNPDIPLGNSQPTTVPLDPIPNPVQPVPEKVNVSTSDPKPLEPGGTLTGTVMLPVQV